MIIRYRSYRLETYVNQDTKRNDRETTYIGTWELGHGNLGRGIWKIGPRPFLLFPRSFLLVPCSHFLISEKILSQNPKVFVYISERFFLFTFSAPDEDSIASNDFLWTRYRGLIPTGELFYYTPVKLNVRMISSYGTNKKSVAFLLNYM